MKSDAENSEAAKEAAKMSLRQSVGLCADCQLRREQRSQRGSVFYRCARADQDKDFMRYPPLPVLRCRGFLAEPEPESEPESEPKTTNGNDVGA